MRAAMEPMFHSKQLLAYGPLMNAASSRLVDNMQASQLAVILLLVYLQ